MSEIQKAFHKYYDFRHAWEVCIVIPINSGKQLLGHSLNALRALLKPRARHCVGVSHVGLGTPALELPPAASQGL